MSDDIVALTYEAVCGAMREAGLVNVPAIEPVLALELRPTLPALLCRRLIMLTLRDLMGHSIGGVSRLMGMSRRNTTRGIRQARWSVENDCIYGAVFSRLREKFLGSDNDYGL